MNIIYYDKVTPNIVEEGLFSLAKATIFSPIFWKGLHCFRKVLYNQYVSISYVSDSVFTPGMKGLIIMQKGLFGI